MSNTLAVASGKLTGHIEGHLVDAEAKAQTVRQWKVAVVRDGGLTVALGDGANDLPMFAEADVAIAYRAKPVVRAQATHALDTWLGRGAELLRLMASAVRGAGTPTGSSRPAPAAPTR